MDGYRILRDSCVVLFHGKRHPPDMGADEVAAILSYLAVGRGVSHPRRTKPRQRCPRICYSHRVNTATVTPTCLKGGRGVLSSLGAL